MTEDANAIIILFACGIIGLLYGIWNYIKVNNFYIFKHIKKNQIQNAYNKTITKVDPENERQYLLEKGSDQDDSEEKKQKLEELSLIIKNGAISFLFEEYIYLTIFIVIFGGIVYFFGEIKEDGSFYTTAAFVIGAYTSIICGYIGMMVATSANAKTAYFAQ